MTNETFDLAKTYQSVLDHVEDLLDSLVGDTRKTISSRQLERVEDWLENTAASLVSWALDIRLEEHHFDTIPNDSIAHSLRTAFKDIQTSADAVYEALLNDSEISLPNTTGYALERLSNLSTNLRLRLADSHQTGPLQSIKNHVEALDQQCEVSQGEPRTIETSNLGGNSGPGDTLDSNLPESHVPADDLRVESREITYSLAILPSDSPRNPPISPSLFEHSSSFTDTPFSVDDFVRKLHTFTVVPEGNNNWPGKPFVLGTALTSWLKSPVTGTNIKSYAALLLELVSRDRGQRLPITDTDVLSGERKCPLMFSMLLEIGHGDLVADFQICGIHDSRLPTPLHDLSQSTKRILSEWDAQVADDLIHQFAEKQWKYFPLMLSKDMQTIPLESQMRLPICKWNEVHEEQGMARPYMIAVPGDFVTAELRKIVPRSAFDHPRFGTCYRFTLMDFPNQSQTLFEAELRAYDELRDHKHIIRCFGGFSHVEDGRISHGIVLEYGECNLSEYFDLTDPPVLIEDIELFWCQLFNVIEAVKDIHDLEEVEGHRRWHGGIGLDKILLAENQFKLADPGCVNWARLSSRWNMDFAPGTMSTYDPPEVSKMGRTSQYPWAVDIWSIGCLLSEAATWIVLGKSGRAAYSAAREEANTSKARPINPAVDVIFSSDCFHDGQHVLQAVKEWHHFLRTMVRPNDAVTNGILSLIDEGLLVSRPRRRIYAEVLRSAFQDIHTTALRERSNDQGYEGFKLLVRGARQQIFETWTSDSQAFGGSLAKERKPQVISPLIPTTAEPNTFDRFGKPNLARSLSHLISSAASSRTATVPYMSSSQVSRTRSVFDAYYERRRAESHTLGRSSRHYD